MNRTPFNQRPVRQATVAELSISPIIRNRPRMENDNPEYQRMMSAWEHLGNIPPLWVVNGTEIIAGRHRYWFAKRNPDLLPTVPVIDFTPEEARLAILLEKFNRKSYTPGQKAFEAVPDIEQAFLDAQTRRAKNAAKNETNAVRFDSKTVDEWAAEIGCSVRLLQQANEIHELFKDKAKRSLTDRDDVSEDSVTFAEFWTPRIMRDEEPYGLGYVLTGIKQILSQEQAASTGRQHTGGKPKKVEKQLELFTSAFRDEVKRWAYFEKFDEETREQHFKAVRTQAAKLPAEQLEQMAAYHQKLAREFTKAAKAGKDE